MGGIVYIWKTFYVLLFFFFGAQSTCYKKRLESEVDAGSNLGYLEV